MTARYGLIIDLGRCTGCQACVLACQMEHGWQVTGGIRIESTEHRARTRTGFPDARTLYLPVTCMQCDPAPCLESCPEQAFSRRSDGIIVLDEGKCSGCGLCLDSCPYGALVEIPGDGKVWKCDLCATRIEEGIEPFCVTCCGMNAIRFVDLSASGESSWPAKRRPHTFHMGPPAKTAVSYLSLERHLPE